MNHQLVPELQREFGVSMIVGGDMKGHYVFHMETKTGELVGWSLIDEKAFIAMAKQFKKRSPTRRFNGNVKRVK